MTLTLAAIRPCLDGGVPAQLATCSPEGMPNVTYVSEIHYVDPDHVALSYQFFNKTRRNVMANPMATALVNHPVTVARYRLSLRFLRTETEGPVFEAMKAKLAGIASHTGMRGVFRLLGSDIYRIVDIERVPGPELLPPTTTYSLLAMVRACAERMNAGTELSVLLEEPLALLEERAGIRHAMILLLDESGERLYTVASRGYDPSGLGSEIPMGAGVIGVAARERAPIRVTHMTSEYAYSRAVGDSAKELDGGLDTEIPLPGLSESRSQLAVPIAAGPSLLGVLYAESPEDGRFGYEEEDALAVLAAQMGLAMQLLARRGDDRAGPAPAAASTPTIVGKPVRVKRYREDDTIFLDEEYLIKGVAGAVLWKILSDHVASGRVDFSNRELRLDPSIRLPEVTQNLEARLILLARRLRERCDWLRLDKAGRGRLRLCRTRPIELVEIEARGH